MTVPAPRQHEAGPPPALADLPVAEVAKLRSQLVPAVETALERGVRWMRLSGASWADVGRALGVTRQSAHERYRHVDGYDVQLCLVEGVAFMRCTMTGAAFRDPAELRQAAHLVLDVAQHPARTEVTR